MMHRFIVFILILKFVYSASNADGRAGNVEYCRGSNYTIDGEYSMKNLTDGQLIKAKVWLSEDFGNDNKYSCKISKYVGKGMKQIMLLKGTGACSAVGKYGGRLWLDVLKKANVQSPSQCPIKKGTYTIDWFKIVYSEISLLTLLPKDTYRVDCSLLDKEGHRLKACINVDFIRF